MRHIFEQYIRLGSVFDLYGYLKDNGHRSKRRTTTTGRNISGSVLSRGTLYHLLSNPLSVRKATTKWRWRQS